MVVVSYVRQQSNTNRFSFVTIFHTPSIKKYEFVLFVHRIEYSRNPLVFRISANTDLNVVHEKCKYFALLSYT